MLLFAPTVSGPPTGSSSQAANFFSRVWAAGVTLDTIHVNATDALITGLLADGTWAACDALWLFATQNKTAALLNLVSSNFNCTIHGNPTFVANAGFTAGSASDYLDTGINTAAGGTNFTQNSAHIAAWSFTNNNPSGSYIGNRSGSNLTDIYAWDGGAGVFGCNQPAASGQVPFTAQNKSSGYWHVFRASSGLMRIYLNGNQVSGSNATATSVAPNSGDLYVLGRNLIGTGNENYCTNQIALAHVGSYINAVSSFYTRFTTYLTAVYGAAPPT